MEAYLIEVKIPGGPNKLIVMKVEAGPFGSTRAMNKALGLGLVPVSANANDAKLIHAIIEM